MTGDQVKRLGVVGAGQMGQGIAQIAAQAGVDVVVVDAAVDFAKAGVGKIKKQLDTAKLDDAILKRQQAIIGSMTRGERKNPKLLNASRKKRVASGSGTSVQDINKLVKMHRQMADMMKAMGKKRGLLGQLFGGGPPPELPAELPAGATPPPGFPGLPPGLAGLRGGLPRGLPGLPGMPRGLPGLPGSKKR